MDTASCPQTENVPESNRHIDAKPRNFVPNPMNTKSKSTALQRLSWFLIAVFALPYLGFRPESIGNADRVQKVIIDAGHGGKDPGSLGPYDNEKVYTLKIARLVRDILQSKGYRVVMTRDSDVFVSLANRVNIANKYKNAIFISIHFNSSDNAGASGIETFTISPVGVPHMGRGVRAGDFQTVPGNVMDSASIMLATAVHSRSLLYLSNDRSRNNFRMNDRGIKRARFDVLTGIKIPAILFEGGFLSNRVEARKVHTPAYQQALADAIARAVDVYRTSITRR